MKGRSSGKKQHLLAVDEPLLSSDHEPYDDDDDHRKENQQHTSTTATGSRFHPPPPQQQPPVRRQSSWKRRLGFGGSNGNSGGATNVTPKNNNKNNNKKKKEKENVLSSSQRTPEIAKQSSDRSQFSIPSNDSSQSRSQQQQQQQRRQQTNSPPERQGSQSERQRSTTSSSNDSMNRWMHMEYDDNEQHDNDDEHIRNQFLHHSHPLASLPPEEKTAMFLEEDLFAVANLKDRTVPAPKTTLVKFADEGPSMFLTNTHQQQSSNSGTIHNTTTTSAVTATTTLTCNGDVILNNDNHFADVGSNSFPEQEFVPDEDFAKLLAQAESYSTTATPRKGNHNNNASKTTTTSTGNNIKSVSISRTRAMLSRPFGRSSLPLKTWSVEVSPAEWDGEEHSWKYRILVQRRMQVRDANVVAAAAANLATSSSKAPPDEIPSNPVPSTSSSSSNVTTAYTWRSLSDFIWLETALRAEYHGGLLLPLLSIALGTSDLASYTQHEVEANLLQDWLSDVLNGIRGQGELLLPSSSKSVNLMTSEAMEAFLYRNTDQLALVKTNAMKTMTSLTKSTNNKKQPALTSSSTTTTTKSTLDRPIIVTNATTVTTSSSGKTDDSELEEESFVQALFAKPFATTCGSLESVVCGHSSSTEDTQQQQRRKSTATMLRKHLPATVMTCSSPALATASSLNVQDSFVENNNPDDAQQLPIQEKHQQQQISSRLASHSLLLQAQRDLVEGWYGTSMIVMDKLRILLEEESQLGAAWKRFAITLSNLFSYEKDVEHARIGSTKLQRENMPYRKIHKSTIDECLRVLAKHKLIRSVPSLRLLNTMLTAYVGDLSAAGPAIQTFEDALEQMEYLRLEGHGGTATSTATAAHDRHQSTSSSSLWPDQLFRNVLGFSLFQESNTNNNIHGTNSSRNSPNGKRPVLSTSLSSEQLESQKRAFELRVLTHEALLRDGLTALCRTTLLRTARMAWKFYHAEASQATFVQSAAMTLRAKLKQDVNRDILSKLISRHTNEEKVDFVTEMNLVNRIVTVLGTKDGASSSKRSLNSSENVKEETVEVDKEVKSPEEILAEEALQVARERLGRWNAKVAMSILKAVGVEEANVDLEETTRDLRMVRKYAIGLRENLGRCIESLQVLIDTVRKPIRIAQDVQQQETPEGRNNNRQAGEDQPNKNEENGATRHIRDVRRDFLSEIAKLLSGKIAEDGSQSQLSSISVNALSAAGINTFDPAGWSSAIVPSPASSGTSKGSPSRSTGRCGETACAYFETKDLDIETVLGNMSRLFDEYNRRVEGIESFVYMECVGIQLEKHFSNKRTKTLTAFEKKTDITTAITIATRKHLPLLVNELQVKLKKVGADKISATTVKEAKELHLESKTLKAELHDLAMRRLMRARETCNERAIDIMNLWAEYEEGGATFELKALEEAIDAVLKGLRKEDTNAFLAHANSNSNR